MPSNLDPKIRPLSSIFDSQTRMFPLLSTTSAGRTTSDTRSKVNLRLFEALYSSIIKHLAWSDPKMHPKMPPRMYAGLDILMQIRHIFVYEAYHIYDR